MPFLPMPREIAPRPLAGVRTRWHALRVFLVQAAIDAEARSLAPTRSDAELEALAEQQRRSLEGLLETARVLPPASPLRRAAERAVDTGSTCLAADPDSETYALAAHEFEVALRELRGEVLRVALANVGVPLPGNALRSLATRRGAPSPERARGDDRHN